MVVTLVVVVVVVAVVAVVLVVLVVVVEKGDELELKVNIGATKHITKTLFCIGNFQGPGSRHCVR